MYQRLQLRPVFSLSNFYCSFSRDKYREYLNIIDVRHSLTLTNTYFNVNVEHSAFDHQW